MPIDPSHNISFGLKYENSAHYYYKKEYSRSYFLLLNNGGKYDAYIMTVIADSSYLKNDLSKLDHNTYSKRDSDFSGVVLYYTPKGKYVSGWSYTNGQINIKPASTQTASNTTVQSTGSRPVHTNTEASYITCYVVYETTWIDNVAVSVEILDSGCYSSGGGGSATGGGGSSSSSNTPPPVPPVPCPDNNSGGGTGLHSIGNSPVINTAPTPIHPPGTGGGGFPPPTTPGPCKETQTIENNIENNCLKTAVNDAIGKGLNTFTAEMTNFLFGNDAGFDLVLEQTSTFPANVDAKAAQIGNWAISIQFNGNTLPSSSKEYIAATLMHEALHGMMDVFGNHDEFKNHTGMATNYVTTMSKDLQKMFPGLPAEDATAMAWGGLGDTVDWKNMVKNNPTQANKIVDINKAYKDAKGKKGKRC